MVSLEDYPIYPGEMIPLEDHMDVSENSGFYPQIIHGLIGVFHYKPSILGNPLFLETLISFHLGWWLDQPHQLEGYLEDHNAL